MITIVLPGYSPRNKEWADEVKKNLKLGHKVIVHEWEHWNSSGLSFSVRKETDKILEKVGREKVNFIAKSVGTRVLMHLAPLLQKQINNVILCGIPTRGTSETAIKTYSEGFKYFKPKQVVIYQNTKDPLANYLDIKKFVGSINSKVKIVEKPRSDHHYPYYEDFQNFLHS
jgi:predicted alpha/beta hydrolase family esterase